jgi:undecaprenyl-diphosphatase
MKQKKIYQLSASFSLVLFVILGYLVKFFPKSLTHVDKGAQTLVSAVISDNLTTFLRFITHFAGFVYVLILFGILVVIFLMKKWYAELLFLTGNLVLTTLLVPVLKTIYGRERPNLEQLVVENTLSFPSGHASISMIFYACLMLVIYQRLRIFKIRWLTSALLIFFIVVIGFSRLYLGVHYLTDILGGWLLSGSLLLVTFPNYDEIRFKWRFKGVQK